MSYIGGYNPGLLRGVKHLHFIGIGGSGMYPLVQILNSRGYEISGSDVNEGSIIDAERALGITVYMGHDPQNVVGADMVIYSAAIHDDNPELQEADARGIPTLERSVLLGYVSRLYPHSVCVAGTHGKTTTTCMITTMLELAGRDPAAVIGGKLPLIGGYGKAGTGSCIVVEACEFAETFLRLTPHIAVLLNIDNDHLDYYGTMGQLKLAFKKFALMATNTIVANADDEGVIQVINSIDRNVRTFGIQKSADYRATNIREYKPGFYEFDVLEWDNYYAHLCLAAPGYHNIYNALAMVSCARVLGLEASAAEAAARSFAGAGRRFEILGEENGVTIADDYAHHPTEVAATLATAKKLGFKKVWAVHQPFTYSRTRTLLHEFAEVLKAADRVVLTPIMGSREVDDGSVRSEDLAALIPGCVTVAGLKEAADYIKANAEPGDLVLTLGCGDVYKAARMMLQ